MKWNQGPLSADDGRTLNFGRGSADNDGDLLVALAARIGTTRLIDNIRCTVHGDCVVVDLGEVIG